MADEIVQQTKSKFLKAIEVLKGNLASIRTGRASSALIEEVFIEAYSTKMRLKELATINTPDVHLIMVTPYDQSIIGNISKGIQEANIGLNPIIDSQAIRIVIPPLTEERRKEFVKMVSQKIESTRIMIRQIRQDAMDELNKLEKNGDIGEDDKKRESHQIEELNKEMNAEAETLGEVKEKDIMQI